MFLSFECEMADIHHLTFKHFKKLSIDCFSLDVTDRNILFLNMVYSLFHILVSSVAIVYNTIKSAHIFLSVILKAFCTIFCY